MVSALRGLTIGLWALLVPLILLTLEFRLLTHWETRINVDLLLLVFIFVAALLGGAALFCIRTSFSRRAIMFGAYMLLASATLFLLYPILACMFSNCP